MVYITLDKIFQVSRLIQVQARNFSRRFVSVRELSVSLYIHDYFDEYLMHDFAFQVVDIEPFEAFSFAAIRTLEKFPLPFILP